MGIERGKEKKTDAYEEITGLCVEKSDNEQIVQFHCFSVQ